MKKFNLNDYLESLTSENALTIKVKTKKGKVPFGILLSSINENYPEGFTSQQANRCLKSSWDVYSKDGRFFYQLGLFGVFEPCRNWGEKITYKINHLDLTQFKEKKAILKSENKLFLINLEVFISELREVYSKEFLSMMRGAILELGIPTEEDPKPKRRKSKLSDYDKEIDFNSIYELGNEMDLSATRLCNCLRSGDIETYKDLKSFGRSNLFKLRGYGTKSHKLLLEHLSLIGFRFN